MTHLCHTILPIPECCGGQMRLCGNLSLHELEYQCNRCFGRLRVAVAFHAQTRPAEIPADVKQATDETQ